MCVECLEPALHVHEIVPKSINRRNWKRLDNRVTLCQRCHDRVHAEGTARWASRLRARMAYVLELFA
jgi:5-methylcytosine-specific restriction endonuclease McrA